MMPLDWFWIAGVVVPILSLWCGGCWLTGLVVLGILAFIRFIFLPADGDMLMMLLEKFGSSVDVLKGQVIWITGASSGLGAALAVRLAHANAKLILSARSKEKLESVKKQCIDTGGVQDKDVLVLQLDVTDLSKQQSAFDAVLDHFGQLDILVNNAGRTQRATFEKIDTAVDRELFELNVFSLISLTRIVTRYFLESGHGHIVVTSSIAGKIGSPLSSTYAASKHALQGYFESLRYEKLGEGLKITMLCPGPFRSNILLESFTEHQGEKLGKDQKGEIMSAERCAELSAVAIANGVSEAWILGNPYLALLYATQYFPAFVHGLLPFIPIKAVVRLRDGGRNILDAKDS